MFFHNNKKSQAAIFIIIGIIILAFFGFMIYKYSESAKSRISPSIPAEGSSLPKSSPVYDYINLCLNDASAEGIFRLGAQGGYIFKEQDGQIINFPIKKIYNFNSTVIEAVSNVSYLILKSDDDAENIALASNPYPCVSCGKFIGTEPLFCSFSDTFFCAYGNLFLMDLDSSSFSMKKQLESSIKKKTLECLDFGIIEAKLGHKIKRGDISVDVVFGDSDVSVLAKIPVVIETPGGKPITEFLEFTSLNNVRLKKIYDFLTGPPYEFLYSDVYLLNYSALLNGNAAAQQMEKPFEIKVYHNANGYDDIVMIIDNSSVLAGRPYVFQYARQNRAPVLKTIHTPTIFSDVDVIALQNESFELHPEAVDPDEDDLTFSYSGWNSGLFMNSSLYRSTKQNASLVLSSSDAGAHNITVKVSDGAHSDWQLVRVLVGYFREENACENSKYGKRLIQVFPDHPPDIEIGFAPVDDWGGCSATDALSDGVNVFTCSGNTKVLIPAGQCCSAGIPASSYDPCANLGFDPNCILSANRGCPGTCAVTAAKNTGQPCGAAGSGKKCKADGTCA